MTPDLAQLLQNPARVAALPSAEARALLLQLAPLQEALRLQALHAGGTGAPEASLPPAALRARQALPSREGPELRPDTRPPGARSSLLSVKEAAVMLSCSEATVRKWVSRRQLPTVKVGRLTRLRLSDLEALLTRGLRPARADKA